MTSSVLDPINQPLVGCHKRRPSRTHTQSVSLTAFSKFPPTIKVLLPSSQTLSHQTFATFSNVISHRRCNSASNYTSSFGFTFGPRIFMQFHVPPANAIKETRFTAEIRRSRHSLNVTITSLSLSTLFYSRVVE